MRCVTRTLVRLGDGATASVVEELVASEEAAAHPPAGQAFFAGTTEVILGAGASLQVASLQELGDDTVAFQHRHASIGEGATMQWALAQLGGRLVRSRVENRLVGDRSSVEQVEIVFGADEQLFDLTSYTTHIGRDTTGDLLSKAALLEKARTYLKGLITIEKSAIGTDSFLGEFGMNLSKAGALGRDPVARDRPAGLPPGDALRARSGRSTRRSSSTSSRAASRPTRRASSSCSASSSRWSPGCRWRPPRTGCASCSKPSGRPGPMAPPAPPPPDASTTSVSPGHPRAHPRPTMRRIDLLGVDEVADGEMKMAFVDGTDQVLVINIGGEVTAVQGVCSHEYFELDKGFLTNGTLTCALHLSRFDLTSGEPLDPPAEEPLAVYPVVVEDGRIMIEVPDGPLEISE